MWKVELTEEEERDLLEIQKGNDEMNARREREWKKFVCAHPAPVPTKVPVGDRIIEAALSFIEIFI